MKLIPVGDRIERHTGLLTASEGESNATQDGSLRRMSDDASNVKDKSSSLAESFIEHVRAGVTSRTDIRALALVGSYARGDAHEKSDVDLVLVCSKPTRYLNDTSWVSELGLAMSATREDWGKVQSVRVRYQRVGSACIRPPGCTAHPQAGRAPTADNSGDLEVELGITGTDWATDPPDEETIKVLEDGVVILLDRDGALARAVMHLTWSA